MNRLTAFRSWIVLCSMLVASGAFGADEAAPTDSAPKIQWYGADGKLAALPASPDKWMNCSPLDLAKLENKALVFYFFEEQCPTCEKKWEGLLAAAEQNSDKPVVFIAVNSGNTPEQIRGYLSRNNIKWPVIVDPDRSFEKEALAAEISLNNIYQVRVLTPDGKWRGVSPDQFGLAAETAAETGSWNVDPTTMPEELLPVWQRVEIGDYGTASKALMRAGKQGNAETKEAAKQLYSVVKASMDADLEAIKEQLQAGEEWAAFQAIESFQKQYDGYPVPAAVAKKYDELKKSDGVQQQHKAAKKLAAAIRAGSKNTPAAIERAVAQLETLIEEFPGTEAADEAQKLIEQVKSAGGAS
ncbi:TlpA family protein disulfide reductase [Aeoliella sp. SH292]|uniref:TlpA family protein disulfide reductase n=1 Tax=Aeoliella sp. SH292 TaxID=3454464 RepID=UPI003F9A76A3